MLKILVLFLIFPISVIADDTNYLQREIPVFTGGFNVSVETNDKFFTKELSYELLISNTDEIYEFYNKYFESLGWENPMKEFGSTGSVFQGKWNSYRSAFTQEGFPEVAYAGAWKAPDIPAMATASMKLIKFENGFFHASIIIGIFPEIDRSPLFKLQELLVSDPKNIFILHEATGGNPFEIDKVNLSPKEKLKTNKVVSDYYDLVNEILKQYEKYGIEHLGRKKA